MIDCERVLKILKDKKPHRNFDLLEIFGGGFALAARVWDLRKPIGRYRLNIISGPPKKFGKKRISSGDWYYQLAENRIGMLRRAEGRVFHYAKVREKRSESPFAFNVKEHREITPDHIYQGHALDVLRTFPDGCVDTIITSPPYWGLRDYGDDTRVIWDGQKNCEHIFGEKITKHDNLRFRGKNAVVGNNKNQDICSNNKVKTGFCYKCGAWYGQLGLEPTLLRYLRHLLQITAELKRVLKPTGVLFWNHGDSYGGSGCGTNDYKTEASRSIQGIGKNTNLSKTGGITQGFMSKCMVMQNYRLILKMIDEQGWILRNDIKWVKPNHMPSSVKDRFANGYEPVFMLVKNKKYWFDLDAVREPHKDVSIARATRGVSDTHKYSSGAPGQQLHSGINKPRTNWKHQSTEEHEKSLLHPAGKNPGDIWIIPTQPFSEAHFATFPEKLIAPMIKCACPEWICKKCGKARVRITKKSKRDELYTYQKVGIPGESNQRGKRERCGQYQAETIGWTDCGCNAGWRQGIALDPLMGSGTVPKMTRLLHRRYVGIEISKKYIKIENRRLAQGIFDF